MKAVFTSQERTVSQNRVSAYTFSCSIDDVSAWYRLFGAVLIQSPTVAAAPLCLQREKGSENVLYGSITNIV